MRESTQRRGGHHRPVPRAGNRGAGAGNWPRPRRAVDRGWRRGISSLCLALALAPGPARADISLPFAPPLMALDRQANVPDGGRVEILLGVSGAPQGNTYEFIIRSPPTKGRLDYLRVAVAGDSAVISYTHNPSLGGGTDSFTYAVQRAGGGPVSAPARVDIRIADAVPRLLPAPDTLDFGIARAGGGRTRRTFTLKNFGGPTAGRIMPPPPWTVEGADIYKLRRGESATFTVVFEPTRAGRFEGALAFGASPGQILRLVASGEAAPSEGAAPAAAPVPVHPPAPGPIQLPPTAEAGPRVEFASPAPAPAEAPAATASAPTERGSPADAGEPPPAGVPRDWMIPAMPGGEWPLADLRLADGSPSGGGEATLRWKAPPAAPAAYRVERREVFLDEARRPQARWRPLAAEIRAPDAAGNVFARVRGLPTDAGAALRVLALDAAGAVRGHSAGLFWDAPPPSSGWRWAVVAWTLALAALGAGILAWRRRG